MTDGRFSQEVPAFASSDWRKCESSSATQRQCTAGLHYELQAGAFWLTIWSWSWKLVYHLLCTVCGSAEIFMLNKRGYSKVVIFQWNEGYSNGRDGFTQPHSWKCSVSEDLFYILELVVFCNPNKMHDMGFDCLYSIASNSNSVF